MARTKAVIGNEMLGDIIQKVGKQEYASKAYSNPLSDLQREFIECATKIEEIYVERALAQEQDPTGVDTLKRVEQEIKTKYRSENYGKCYTVSISDTQVKEGFTSKEGISKLADKKIEALNRGISIDNFKKTVETINLIPTLSMIKKETIKPLLDKTGVVELMEKVQNDSDMMVYSSKEYNTQFESDTPKDKQVIFTTPQIFNRCKMELANIYNMSVAEIKQKVKFVDKFTDDNVKMILCDEGILRIHPTLYNHEPQRNAKGMFTNHHVNVSGIYAVSEMYNAVVYSTGA